MKKATVLLTAAMLIFVLAGCLLVNPVFTITCTTFHIGADSGQFTVDNTGTGNQLVHITGVDGYGNLILFAIEGSSLGFIMSPIDETYTFSSAPLANPITVTISSPAGHDLPQDTVWYTASGACAGLPYADADGPTPPTFADGRVNNRDAGAPFAVYIAGGELYFYWIQGDSTGLLELLVTAAQIAGVPEFPEVNTLIAANEVLGLYVYRLTDGRFQAQAHRSNGKLYVLIFDATGAYESKEIEP